MQYETLNPKLSVSFMLRVLKCVLVETLGNLSTDDGDARDDTQQKMD